MSVNAISQLTTSNTFQHWLTATQLLIATANTLTNGDGETFYANTRLEIGGPDASLNVITGATINVLDANVINSIDITTDNLVVNQNIADLRVSTDATVGQNLKVHGEMTVDGDTLISGNLVVSGNLTLDEIGFDDLNVSGSANIGNNLIVIGTSDFTGNAEFINAEVTDTFTANIANVTQLTGAANTAIFNSISDADATALAYSIALG